MRNEEDVSDETSLLNCPGLSAESDDESQEPRDGANRAKDEPIPFDPCQALFCFHRGRSRRWLVQVLSIV